MAAILPSLNIDSDALISRHFLPYQMLWIADDSKMRLAEKSVRIGWTFADAFKNVRKRLRHANRDYLFATKDQQSAIEYLATCEKFASAFDYAKSIVARGEDVLVNRGKDDKGNSFTEEVKFGYIKFDNGSRIIAFSSNPYAMAVFGGDVGLDEFAKHPQAEKLWETAQGRSTWGYDLGVWSAHDGNDTLFYQFAREAAEGKGSWSHYKVTMEDAVDMGLVEKINETRGTKMTREAFILDCKNRARLEEVYEQAYNCNPVGSSATIVSWSTLSACRQDYEIERVHLEAKTVREIFGNFDQAKKMQREAQIEAYILSAYPALFAMTEHFRLGFDVAASGLGDLASVYISAKKNGHLKLSGLFTCRTDDWHVIKTVVRTFMKRLPAVLGCGDETGLGRQICWEVAAEFSGRFEGINFSSSKTDMGVALMFALNEQSFIIPDDNDDIAQDFYSIRKNWTGGKWVFSAGQNILNEASHADIAWSGALALRADSLTGGVVTVDTDLGDGETEEEIANHGRLYAG
jgi:phage FluMu gp28-like protein